MIYEKIASTILSIILMSAFLGIFFFTYAAHVEKNIVKNQSANIINDLTEDLNSILPESDLVKLQQISSPYIVAPDLSQEDSDVVANNKILMKKAIVVITVFVAIGTACIFLLTRLGSFPIKYVLLRNFIILFFIALTEFCFLTFFAQNYITIDANFVKYKVLTFLTDNST